MLRDRVGGTGLEFRHLTQADFVLYIRSCIDDLRASRERRQRRIWWPETLLHVREHEGAFEIFLRAESGAYFNCIKHFLGVEAKSDLNALFQAYASNRLEVPRWVFQEFNPAACMCYDKLATRR
jgi:hypothetical protein